jgi:outer membrane protein assembly factor BamE (lipoprotein component of BamABCDE complex)
MEGNTKDVDKSMIKSIANKKENIFGDKIRVILGSPSVKEGFHLNIFNIYIYWILYGINRLKLK